MILRGDHTAEKQSEYDRETIFHFRYLQRIDLNYFMHRDGGPCLLVRLAPHHASRKFILSAVVCGTTTLPVLRGAFAPQFH